MYYVCIMYVCIYIYIQIYPYMYVSVYVGVVQFPLDCYRYPDTRLFRVANLQAPFPSPNA